MRARRYLLPIDEQFGQTVVKALNPALPKT